MKTIKENGLKDVDQWCDPFIHPDSFLYSCIEFRVYHQGNPEIRQQPVGAQSLPQLA